MLHLWLTLLLALAPATEKLTAVVDLRGISAREAFDKLREGLHEQIVIAREAPADSLERDVRFHAEHLAPDQAVRWVARLVGLEAVHTDNGYYVATAAQLKQLQTPLQGTHGNLLARPATTAPAGAGSTPRAIADLQVRELVMRRGAIFWQDAPLTRVCDDLSRVFGVDAIIHPDLLANEGLMEWERPDVSFQEACKYLADELKATVELRDGAIWIHPAETQIPAAVPASAPAVTELPRSEGERSSGLQAPASQPTLPIASAGPQFSHDFPPASPDPKESSPPDHQVSSPRPSTTTQPASPRAGRPTVIYRAPPPGPAVAQPESLESHTAGPYPPPGRLTVDASIRDWSAFARHVELATGWDCHVRNAERRYEPLDIDGSTADALEALKLMSKLDYRILAGARPNTYVLELDILLRR